MWFIQVLHVKGERVSNKIEEEEEKKEDISFSLSHKTRQSPVGPDLVIREFESTQPSFKTLDLLVFFHLELGSILFPSVIAESCPIYRRVFCFFCPAGLPHYTCVVFSVPIIQAGKLLVLRRWAD